MGASEDFVAFDHGIELSTELGESVVLLKVGVLVEFALVAIGLELLYAFLGQLLNSQEISVEVEYRIMIGDGSRLGNCSSLLHN